MSRENRVFVTGGTGFIGAELIKELLNEKYQVRALARSVEKAEHILPGLDIEWVAGDLDDKNALSRGMEGCSQVYHLAGFAKLWHRDSSIFTRVNVTGTHNVLSAALETGVKRVVHTSTAGAIGPSEDEPTNETMTYRGEPMTMYERSKIEAERIIPDYTSKGLEVIIVNPTRVFGPGQLNQSNAVTKLIRDYSTGSWRLIPGDGSGIGNYVFVQDVVKGHLLAMQHGKLGERYILGGTNLSYNTFFETLGKLTGKRRSMIKIPIGVMMTLAKLQEWKANTFNAEPLITTGFARKYLHHWQTSSSKALNELGYEITSFDHSVEQTLEWLQGNSSND